MSVTTRPNTKYFYSEFKLNGKLYIKSTKTTNKKLAEKIDQQLYLEALEQSKLGGKEITLTDALKSYHESLAESGYKLNVKGVMNWLEKNMDTSIKMTKVDTKFLYQFQKLKSTTAEPSTVKLQLGCISRVIKHAKKLGYDTCEVTLPDIKIKNTKTRTLTTEEQELLLNEFKNPKPRSGLGQKVKADLMEWHDVCVCLFSTGARVCEILEMKWEQVDLDKKLFYVYRKKTDSNSVLPMSDRAYEVLKNRPRTCEWVFPNADLTNHKRYSAAAFNSACERAGLEGVTFHKIRHSVITNYCKAGLSLQQTMTMSGHASIQSLMRYNHLTSQDVVEMAREIVNK